MENNFLSIEMMEKNKKRKDFTTSFNKYLLSTYYAPGTVEHMNGIQYFSLKP